MDGLEQAKLLSIAAKFAKAEAEEVRNEVIREFHEYFNSPTYELERAKLLSIASKFAKSESNLVREELISVLKELEEKVISENFIPGPQGERGLIGPEGPQGLIGPVGPQGETGPVGPMGLAGNRGETGGIGPEGKQGERGKQGEKGAPGERGQRGERGERGPSGIDGTNGSNGRDGTKGEAGERGPQGLPGRNGANGKDGPVGPKGEKGDKGDPGSEANVEPLKKEFESFKDAIDKRMSRLAFNISTTGGSFAGSGEVRLNRLDDVDYVSVDAATEGQALVWDNTLKKWKAGNAVGDSSGGDFSSEAIDYGTIVGAVDIELSRDYGTL